MWNLMMIICNKITLLIIEYYLRSLFRNIPIKAAVKTFNGLKFLHIV